MANKVVILLRENAIMNFKVYLSLSWYRSMRQKKYIHTQWGVIFGVSK